MNVTLENVDALNAKIIVDIVKDDYESIVDQKLREYRRKANMPGFRVGNVPMPIIRKMYGTSVLADEVFKLASKAIQEYIAENKLDIIGYPIESEVQKPFNLEEQTEFTFSFDMAYQPKIEFKLEETEINYYNISVEDEFISKQVDTYRKNYGISTNPEISSIEDRLFGKFEELDANNEIKQNGVSNSASILSKYVSKNDILVGLKKGDKINLNIKELFENNPKEIAYVLNTNNEIVETINDNFSFTLEEIHRIELAELNEELFKKVFPYSDIKTEEEFINELKSEFAKQTTVESDKRLIYDVQKQLLENLNFELPVDFLKRWLLRNDEEKKLTQEQIEQDFEKFEKSMKWQLIENIIIKEYNIQVTKEDIANYIKSWFSSNTGMPSEELDAKSEEIVNSILKNKEEAQRIQEKLFNDKILEVYKEKLVLKKTDIKLDEFIKLT